MRNAVYLLLALMFILGCTGCAKTMDDVIAEEPHFMALVTEVRASSILVEVCEDDPMHGMGNDTLDVSLDVEMKDSMTHFNVGDKVCVYYDGLIQETYPGRPNQVYAITLIEPAPQREAE